MKPWKLALLGLLALLLVSCDRAEPNPEGSASIGSARPASSAQATAESIPETRAADAGGSTVENPVEDQSGQEPGDSAGEALPDPTLFDLAWDDPTPFAAGLVEGEAAALDLLAEANIYHLDLTLSADLRNLAGRQEVRYTNQEDITLDELFLHLYPNLLGSAIRIGDVSVNGVPTASRLASSVGVLGVPLASPLAPGEQTVLQIAFEVGIPIEAETSYGFLSIVDGVLALAHFYPQVAVFDDEGWNTRLPSPNGDLTYADAGFYLVRLNVPAEQVVVATGVEVARETAGDRQILTIATGPARDFFLASSDRYEMISEQAGPITVNSYGFPEFRRRNQEALKVAIAALNSLAKRIGPYPYTEFDIAPTVNLALGVEYPGTVVLNALLYNPDESIRDNPTGLYFESTVAHEVGHQWFYNVVGNDQLDEPWLDEALTQYVTYLYYQDVYGPGAANAFRQSFLDRWERVEQEEIPIGLPAREYSGQAYASIVYGRGPLFFEALADKMGQESFEAFLRDYFQQYEWGIATGPGLKSLAEARCDCDLSPMFADWVGDP